MAAGWLAVADIADRLDRMGLPDQAMAGLRPALAGMAAPRFAGPAVTVSGSPGQGPDPDPHYQALDSAMQPGGVLLIAAGGYLGAAVFGETRGRGLQAAGCAGVVIDGVIRDAEAVAALGLGVVCRGTHPARFGGRWRFGLHGVAVTCCGVMVRPGDWIVADADGVIVVPKEHRAGVMGA